MALRKCFPLALTGGMRTVVRCTLAGGGTRRISTKVADVQKSDVGRVHITFADNAVFPFDPFWLRDHCRDEVSYQTSTMQRNYDTFMIPLGVDAKRVKLMEDTNEVEVEFADGHRTLFTGRQLREWALRLPLGIKGGTGGGGYEGRSLWNAHDMSECMPLFGWEKVVNGTKSDTTRFLRALYTYGFALATSAPTTDDATREFASKVVGPPQSTLCYGDFWKTEVHSDGGNDTAYTTLALPLHTDGNYFGDMPALQMFHCLKNDEVAGNRDHSSILVSDATAEKSDGGVSILADGFQAAERLRVDHPESFEVLATQQVVYHHTEESVKLRQMRSVIELDNPADLSSPVRCVHFNHADRADLYLSERKGKEFYKHLRHYDRLLRSPEHSLYVHLKAGTVLIFDNW
eukprot:CAMPEP_0113900412 /NCGR_PEP_ID=MMETSP0780_2-20120614/20660_1 /TAXON_ID=652834 /ORGANISM="Palpitomonas bilix" /LENGTH=402 /DNA_ID=CAMNT_0000892863 /DNA_START=154 /DNA_END=1359 /DNA_ORIENTATION=+ /assembly_acc=CAM_ASM_000599